MRCSICTDEATHNHAGGWIGVDLDGTLAEEHFRSDVYEIGTPIPRMIWRVKGWLAEGYEVRIFTARLSNSGTIPRDVEKMRQTISDWTLQHLGTRLKVTNIKEHSMIAFWDDRAVRVTKNTGWVVGTDEVLY